MPQVFAAISAAATAFGATTVGSFLTTTFVGKLLTSVALSALSRALAPKPGAPGIKTSQTQTGGTNPCQFILGRYATAGYAAAPAMSHGTAGKVPNAWLTYVLEVADTPVTALNGLILDGTQVTIGATPHSDYGLPILGDFTDRAWVKLCDGTQTAANPMLVSKYADYPDRPWSVDMIGRGIAHVILTFRYDREIFDSLPTVRMIVDGIRLYDPRLDTSVGGSGAQRWSAPATWGFSRNPIVMVYNILRGITLPDGNRWGGDCAAEDLPLGNWIAAMNLCDAEVTLAAGGTVPRYTAGFEVAVDAEPAAVIEELLKACHGQLVDMGGVWKVRAGGPGLPVCFFSDEDVIATRPEEFDPFPGLSETFNAISATYPEPTSLWESREAPMRTNAAWEAEDGGRRLVAALALPAVIHARQVQHLMQAAIRDHRRMRRHNLTLTPAACLIEPLDVVSWTSARNGYEAKAFEVAQVVEDLRSCLPQLALREVDPTDYDWSPADELPSTPSPGGVIRPAVQAVPGFAVIALSLTDASGAPRRPALQLVWDGAELDDVEALEWELRRSGTTTLVAQGSTHDVEAGQLILAAGILPATAYQARARLVVRRKRAWTAWVSATTPNTRLTVEDLDDTSGPAVPTGLALTSMLSGDRVTLVATWTAVAESGIRYDIRIREGAGNDVPFATSGMRYTWDVLPNTTYTVAVRAVNRIGLTSAYSAEVAHTSARDTVPPAVPAGLTALAGFETIWLKWAANTESDLAGYEVFESATATPAPVAGSAATYSTAANTLVLTGLADNVTKHFWLRAVDSSGNKSAWTARVQATTAGLVAADISSILQEASYAANLVPPLVVSSLPTTGNFAGRMAFLTTDGKLYRYNGGWTRAVDGADLIANSIIAGSFQAGAIRAEDLAADSVLARHLAVGDFTNLVPGADLRDIGDWSFTSPGYYTLNAPSLAATQQDSFGELIFTPVSGGVAGWVRARSKRFPLKAGDSIRAAFQGWRATVGSFWFQARVNFYDRSNTSIGTSIIATRSEVDPVLTAPFAVNITVPANTTSAALDFIADNGLTTVPIRFAAPMVRIRNGGEMVVEGVLKAVHMAAEEIITLAAQIRNATITNAHITDLSAAKLVAGTALAGSITVAGTALDTVRAGAAEGAKDPVTRINAGITQINPGKVVISGTTTLADWRKGGDETRIDGGALSANTVAANKLTIGNRALTLTGIEFEHNSPTANSVSWTAGAVRYIDDAGASTAASIPAGNAAWSSGVLYVYWVKGATTLSATTAQGTAFGANNVVLATYQGGTLLDADYGRTVIDGSGIKAQTITATQLIKTAALITEEAQIKDLTVDTIKLKDGAVSVFNVTGSATTATNNSAGLTVVDSFSLSMGTTSYAQAVIGIYSFTLSTTPNNYPSGFSVEVHVAGNLVAELTRAGLDANPNLRRYTLALSRAAIGAASFTISAGIRNAGGYGLINTNLWAIAEKK